MAMRELPNKWTAYYVGACLIEAYRTVAKMPIKTRPNGYISSWPPYQSMTDAEQQQLINELMLTNMLNKYYAERNRIHTVPSGEQIVRMEAAVQWPMRYLKDDHELAAIVTGWADRFFRDHTNEIPAVVIEGLERIAHGLNRDGVAPE